MWYNCKKKDMKGDNMGANWGHSLRLSIFGESHGKAIGINIDGLASGI